MGIIQQVRGIRRSHCALLLLSWLAAANLCAEEAFSLTAEQRQLAFSVAGLEGLGESDRLAVELDGYDVTALISRRETELQLDLPTPLGGGQHPLLVLVFYGNGDVATLLDATLEVAAAEDAAVPGVAAPAEGSAGVEPAAAAATREDLTQPLIPPSSSPQATHQLQALLSNSYRLDQSLPDGYPGSSPYASNGGLSYRGQGGGADWQWQGELDALYDNLGGIDPDGAEWQLPHYRLAASQGNGWQRRGMALGTYNVTREDLLFSAYQRRGAVATLGDPEQGPLLLDVFGLQSEPQTSYQHRLGYPREAAERSSGGVLTLTPLRDDPQLLQLSSAYVSGETQEGGVGFWSTGEQTRYGGDSWNLAMDSRLGDNSLWLHADYARSRFDSDGLGTGSGPRNDDAHDLQLQFNSGRWFPSGPLDQWSLTLQRRQVGLDFYSLGYLALPGDLQLDRLNWQGYFGSLQLDAELARETNNLDDADKVADQTVERRALNAYYYPMVDAEALPWRLLGTPSLNAGVTETRRRQDREDAQQVGFDLNDDSRESLVGVNFFHNRWNWSVQHSLQTTQDHSRPVEQQGFLVYQPPSDQRNRFTTLQVGYMPSDQLSLSTSWQWSQLAETDADNLYGSSGQGLDLAWQIVPRRWRLNSSYFRGRDRSEFGEEGLSGDTQRQQTAALQLTWSVSQPEGLRPGLDWFVKGSYAKQESQLYAQELKNWQVLLGFDLRWDTHSQ
ncbi:MAG: hypothetical protein ABWY06_17630 [Pseudomonas sp.]|uniref:hypothetical protein n=1 Tax=Pseudomonas sp. TaxID=306 RepID=UPI00339325E6